MNKFFGWFGLLLSCVLMIVYYGSYDVTVANVAVNQLNDSAVDYVIASNAAQGSFRL